MKILLTRALRCYPRGSSGERWNKNEPAIWSSIDGATPALTAVGSEEKVVSEGKFREVEREIPRLKRILVQKTVDIETLKETVRIGDEKN